ncbi:MAG: di-trans,poly-cis-decaprenylcistransferase [Elusimicrobia bacterium RIFOXYA12_FULL_51_18]|nr:MAG: di-trans,poly-cis-decaprenylcistransferase [Elusimicrobia bacterium RIFOXYA12_FULL_51_18]OGS29556.1 MAG: di-trans,poly-cis-decaprenylcistransferase [Elusimicrobia bacterium RIFOXYA2_FULL_53_38]
MDQLLKKLDLSGIPAHVAVIMDGNRRWAKAKGLPVAVGHAKGVESVRAVVKAASDLGVKALTIYAFSTENWNRGKLEVNALMLLLKKAITEYTKELGDNNVRLMISGRLNEIPASARKAVMEAVERLKSNTGMVLNIALNYGGRMEIIDAVNSLLERGVKKTDEASFSKALYTWPLPDPDLLIRTSGEARLSNFLLWQTAYSEFYITDALWPDFRERQFVEALLDYQARERRKGT